MSRKMSSNHESLEGKGSLCKFFLFLAIFAGMSASVILSITQ
ncbi:hypothetical protein JCM19231_5362 [Vibrio ishigakensis]|uniref:Uncharacterized protein n=1 Tax=Vibrio ishigakensis TaxID=1481914 RepID=A0A0B8NUJ9_9VIBR|nr:hypothetical protein [Vibrio ishigakensis]GAM58215.1 hypothetical protein JCM19231_5362 [Vibrio ishigakensis]GAM68885.1 hypothetical protein JCM19236_2882 [Vibrio sp. JCM 19236]